MITFFQGRGLDANAKAFLNAAGITNGGIETATNNFFLDLKGEGLYNHCRVGYPAVGGTLSSVKYNMFNPVDSDAAFRATYYNNPTVDADGVNWNGTTQYANTHFVPGTHAANKNILMAYYSLTNVVPLAAGWEMAAYGLGTNRYELGIYNAAGNMYNNSCSNVPVNANRGVGNLDGLFIVMRDNANIYTLHNGVLIDTTPAAAGASNTSSVKLAVEERPGPSFQRFSKMKMGFSLIGEEMTVAEAITLSAIINKYMTSLGRNTY